MFKRRNKRTTWQTLCETVWPRGGWARAAQYIKHRVHRLPDTPEKIARGISVGLFVTFSPFFGLHFLIAAMIALVVRANMVAAVLATFVGNPLTFFAIGAVSLNLGRWMLGLRAHHGPPIGAQFSHAFGDLASQCHCAVHTCACALGIFGCIFRQCLLSLSYRRSYSRRACGRGRIFHIPALAACLSGTAQRRIARPPERACQKTG